MGSVFKKTATKPLPVGAQVFVRKGRQFARWIDAAGRKRETPMNEGGRIVVTARTYTAKYRDGNRQVQEIATGCRDERAARSVLNALEKRAELVRAGVLTTAEGSMADHAAVPLAEHIAAFLTHQRSKGVVAVRVKNSESRLNRLATDCGFKRLAELDATRLEKWLSLNAVEGMSAGNRNEYRQELVGFGNWCVRTSRLASNPFTAVPKADAKSAARRQRRAMTEAELVKLLDVARRRPLLDAMMVRRGKRKGEAVAKLRPEVVERLELLGRERALIYKMLVLTGLRKGELASLTVGQLHLDGPHPFADLAAADEKNRQGSAIPLRVDLADDLRQWLADRATALQQAASNAPTVPFESTVARSSERGTSDSDAIAGRLCQPMTGVPQLPVDAPLLTVPAGLVRILDRDLKLAGIDKRDERGRTLDVHALRYSFATLLSKGGVAPRTAQAALRHSSINLTMGTYTDPKLLDIHGALDALPPLPLNTSPEQKELKATGTRESVGPEFAPAFAPTPVKGSESVANAAKTAADQSLRNRTSRDGVNCFAVKRNDPLTNVVNGSRGVERKGIEPSTSALRKRATVGIVTYTFEGDS
jgi:integrase